MATASVVAGVLYRIAQPVSFPLLSVMNVCKFGDFLETFEPVLLADYLHFCSSA